MSTMSPDERRMFARLGLEARLSRKTQQDRRIRDRLSHNLAVSITEAVDVLFQRLKAGKPLALVFHQGDMRVMDPRTRDFSVQASKYPDSVIGTYDHQATRGSVLDDIGCFQPLVTAIR